jgi:molybdopterin molybdotransferase
MPGCNGEDWSASVTQLSEDRFAFGGELMPLDQAQSRIAGSFACRAGVEIVALREATGRVLAREIVAPINLPPFDNSAVDGYAVHHSDLKPDQPTLLPVHGKAFAGHAPSGFLPPGAAARVFTGAMLPAGADTVQMQEDCEERPEGVLIRPGLKAGANRRLAGEDVARGARALAAGRRLMPPQIGLIAALGLERVPVYTRLKVALFSTGDELVEPPAHLAAGQIYDANRAMMAAWLTRLGAEVRDGGILPDDARLTQQRLGEAGQRSGPDLRRRVHRRGRPREGGDRGDRRADVLARRDQARAAGGSGPGRGNALAGRARQSGGGADHALPAGAAAA